MRRQLAIMMVAAAVTGLTGCAPSPSPDESPVAATTTLGSPVKAKDGTPLVVEPLNRIAGSQRVTLAGVGLDLPAGWRTDQPASDHAVVIRLFDGTATDPIASVIVSHQAGADAGAVQAALDGASHSWGEQALGLSRVDVSWRGMPDAAALTFSYDDLNGGDAVFDAMIVAARDSEQTLLVIVLVTAPHGMLESSPAYEVLRTLRFGG